VCVCVCIIISIWGNTFEAQMQVIRRPAD